MEKPNEYNYQKLGMKKYILEYEIDGHALRSKEFTSSKKEAMIKVRSFSPQSLIKFTEVYEC